MQIIAMVSMVIDHVAVAYIIDAVVLRCIGRAAFVIYAFQVMESVYRLESDRTGKIANYLAGLFAVAIISEPFYDMLHYDLVSFGEMALSDQNVIFTLFICACASAFWDRAHWTFGVIGWGAAMAAVALCDTEFGLIGVWLCMGYHISIRKKAGGFVPALLYSIAMSVICVYAGIEIWRYLGAFFAAFMILLYHKKPQFGGPVGNALANPPGFYKKLHHWFYPVHLFVLIYDTVFGYLVMAMAFVASWLAWKLPFLSIIT